MHFLRAIAFCLAAAFPLSVLAQGADIAFGGIRADTTQPVEVTADQLRVDQSDGSATFSGNVLVGQGAMRLSASEIRVEYAEGGQNQIERLHAKGGVTIASGADAAEGAEAIYTISSGQIVLSGNVLLTQGQSALSGDRLTVDLKTGTGTMQGRVKTVLTPGEN